ncbi:hypothetical protein [Nocardioides sp. YIM 152588]|uniref:hypothetical protein n=1 Tax=Nocardioides sp. YIM 152588 TaxID=3158259 RepID=UPI0032E4A916
MAGAAVVTTAVPAMAVTPTGGCWVYSAVGGSAVDSTDTSAGELSSSLASWGAGADYVLTTSGGSTVGDTRDMSLTFNTGPNNGGPAASGTAYYYFSVNGTNLPPVTKAFNAPGFAAIPGDTINGSFTIPAGGNNDVVFRKVIYDIPSFTLRVQCNGQSSGTTGATGINPATTPIDTNVTSSFSAFAVATATVDGITNQNVTNAARAGDVISFTGSDFTSDGTASAELCDVGGGACDAASATTFAVSGGTGSGSVTVPAGLTGAKVLKLSLGGEAGTQAITLLGSPTVQLSIAGGGAGTTVQVTGSNWDPSKSITVGGYQALVGAPPPPATADTPVLATTSATGTLSASFTVQDSTTAFIGASQRPGPGAIFSVAAFTFSGDACTAKEGLATTGECSLLEVVTLTVTAGDLKMSKNAGDVAMSGITLDGTDQVSTGSLQDVNVMDYRGGDLGWALTAKFSGLSGPADIAPDKLTITPACAAAANSDDTVTTGSQAAFADDATAVGLCSVLVGDLGADNVSGGDVAADADLLLDLLINQAAGDYTGTLTLTLS